MFHKSEPIIYTKLSSIITAYFVLKSARNTLGKIMGKFRENVVCLPKFFHFFLKMGELFAHFEHKMGKFWETYKIPEILSRFLPVYGIQFGQLRVIVRIATVVVLKYLSIFWFYQSSFQFTVQNVSIALFSILPYL